MYIYKTRLFLSLIVSVTFGKDDYIRSSEYYIVFMVQNVLRFILQKIRSTVALSISTKTRWSVRAVCGVRWVAVWSWSLTAHIATPGGY